MDINSDIFMRRCFERIVKREASRLDTFLLLGCLLEDEQVRKELMSHSVDVDGLMKTINSTIEQDAKAMVNGAIAPEITDEFKDMYAKATSHAMTSGAASPTQMDVLHVMCTDESLSVNKLIHRYRSSTGTGR